MSEINKHGPVHGACTHSMLYLWAVATYLVAASNVLWSLDHTSHDAHVHDGRASINREWGLRNTAGEWIQPFSIY